MHLYSSITLKNALPQFTLPFVAMNVIDSISVDSISVIIAPIANENKKIISQFFTDSSIPL